MSERSYPTRQAGAPRPDRIGMHRMTIDLDGELGKWLKAETKKTGESKVSIIEGGLTRERRARKARKQRMSAAA